MDSSGEGIPPSGPAESSRHAAGESSREPSRERVDRPVAQANREERYGPVRLARHVKRDGRELILFTREEARAK